MIVTAVILSFSSQAAPDLDRDHTPGVIPSVTRPDVFRNAYGAASVQPQGLDFRLMFANGDEVVAQRVSEYSAASGRVQAEIKARYSASSQYFGSLESNPGRFSNLFSLDIGFHSDRVADYIGAVSSQDAFSLSSSSDGLFAQNRQPGETEASYMLRNVQGSRFALGSYALFFGSLDDQLVDRDSVNASVQILTVVPLPAAALGSMFGLGVLACVRRRPLA